MSEPAAEQRLAEIGNELRGILKNSGGAELIVANMAIEMLVEVRRIRALVRREDIAELRAVHEKDSETTVGWAAGLADRLEQIGGV